MSGHENANFSEDEYLIILQKDELENDKELEQVLKLNKNDNFYLYERSEYIDDEISYFRSSIELLYSNLNSLLNSLSVSTPEKLTLKFKDPRDFINEFFSILENSMFMRIENLKQDIKCFRVKIDTCLNQKLDKFIKMNSENKNRNFLKFLSSILGEKNNSNIYRSFSDNSEKINESQEVRNNELNKNHIQTENLNKNIQLQDDQNKIHNQSDRDETDKLKNIKEFNDDNNSIITENDDQVSISDSFSEKYDIEEDKSDISQKSEPVINLRNKLNLYKKAGTVINGEILSDSISAKLNREKYLELIESYKNLTKTNEIKENVDINQLKL